MNRSVLWILYVHELKMLLRARRTVVMAIVIPAVMMPLMLYAQKYSHDRRERALHAATYRYVITGPLAGRVRQAIQDARATIDSSVRVSGMTMAAPTPCTARATTRAPMPGAMATAADPAVNKPRPIVNRRRRP